MEFKPVGYSRLYSVQLDYLDGKLQEENRNLRRIIKLKDSKMQLNDVVIKVSLILSLWSRLLKQIVNRKDG